MPHPTRSSLALMPVILLIACRPGWASTWNDCGHRVIAAIAYGELRPEARRAVAEMLEHHPAAGDPLWGANPGNGGEDRGRDLLANAAVFPDDARRPGPFKRFDVGRAHYVNYRIMAGGGGVEVLPPLREPDDDDPHGDVLESLETNLAIARDRGADPSDRAVALSWIAHQVGDLHQPLHAVARFGPATPNGDRGGNDVRFGEGNLHAYWDRALGVDATPGHVDALAAELIRDHPRSAFAEPIGGSGPEDWAIEGVGLALGTVYRNLDPALAEFPDPPIGYEADARAAARRRCALAGYRLADLLASIVEAPAGPAPGPHPPPTPE